MTTISLGEYLKEVNKSIPVAAAELDVSVETVRYWIKGKRVPCPEMMTKIFIWSGGRVDPNSFHELPKETGAARANGHDPHPSMQEAAA